MNALADWAITYAIHSSLMLGLVAIATATFVRHDTSREILWRTALIGSLATAAFGTAFPVQPLGGRWLQSVDQPARVTSLSSVTGPRVDQVPRARVADGTGASPTDEALVPPPGVLRDWRQLSVIVWLTAAGILVVILLRRSAVGLGTLKDREPITAGPLLETLAELRRLGGVWAPVRLSVSGKCATPVVIGASEICVPPRFVHGLDVSQQRAALAHELAHVARRDSYWQLAGGMLNAIFFFQPLIILARVRMREASERLCDDWAVRHTGSPLALGQCLANIASWVAEQQLADLRSAPAMAEGGSPLLERVQRLAQGGIHAPSSRAFGLAGAAVLLAATVGTAPVVARGQIPESEGPSSNSLLAKWTAAVDSLQADSVWIGWGISRSRDEAGRMITSSTPGDDRPGGLPFSAAVGEAGVASGAPIAFLFGFSASSRSSGASYDAVDVMLTRSAGAPTNLGGRRVAWLGEAPHEESLNLLRALHQQIPNETVRAEIVATYALHQQPQDDDIAVLERLAFEDPSPRLRQEAASALSDIRRPAAGRALIRIAKRASDPIVRAEAVQQLDEFETEEVIAALVSIAFEEAVREVSLEAVHTLSDFRTPSARAGLRRLAVEHTDAAVRAEALQELTDR